MITEVITVNLETLLADREMTLYRLSKDTGISYNALHKLARGKAKQISFDVLDKICEGLSCTTGDLFEYIPGQKDKGQRTKQ